MTRDNRGDRTVHVNQRILRENVLRDTTEQPRHRADREQADGKVEAEVTGGREARANELHKRVEIDAVAPSTAPPGGSELVLPRYDPAPQSDHRNGECKQDEDSDAE